ncbi:MAG: hypothetical protein PHN92_02100 [Geobacter sp.]|nr:hypothetical protein [Geobacter sp.]
MGTKFYRAIAALETTLQQERRNLFMLRHNLLQRSVEHAVECEGDYAAIAEATAEIRLAISHSETALAEIPQIITELQADLDEVLAAHCQSEITTVRQQNDTLFSEHLHRIVTSGSATPAELLQLRKFAAQSSNPARKYCIDRLVEELEDHARYVATAKTHHQALPVFEFVLEEDQKKGGL